MSVKIELSAEIEANLAAQAAAQGIPLPECLQRLLEEKAATGTGNPLSLEERANFWRDTAGGLPETKLLTDEAISRETIYSGRG